MKRGPKMLEDHLNTSIFGRTPSDDEYREIARGNIEQHLGDVASDYESEEEAADAIYDEAYTLGFDALHDAGVDDATSRRIAGEVARSFAQP